jgi:hypothetical protein
MEESKQSDFYEKLNVGENQKDNQERTIKHNTENQKDEPHEPHQKIE